MPPEERAATACDLFEEEIGENEVPGAMNRLLKLLQEDGTRQPKHSSCLKRTVRNARQKMFNAKASRK